MDYMEFIKQGKKQGKAEAYAELCKLALKNEDYKISFNDIMEKWDQLNKEWSK